MSWFQKRKDKNQIPPVEPAGGNSSSHLNSSSPSDPYSGKSATSSPSINSYAADTRDRYQRNQPIDPYSRGQGNVDSDRSELFSGYNPEKANPDRFKFDGPTLSEPTPGQENEEDVEGIKQQTRFVKQESVNSTRNALRMAREAEETARNTVNKLGSQSEKLANTERHLDVSKTHSQRADDKTDELKQLNRSIFRPVIHFNKDAKRAASEAKIQQRYDEERGEREKTLMETRDTQNRLGQASAYGQREEAPDERRGKTASEQALRKQQRSRFQFEATASDDEIEDELDENLDEISDVAKRLKALGTAMGQELDNQNNRIERIEEKTVNLDNRVFRNTERLKRIK